MIIAEFKAFLRVHKEQCLRCFHLVGFAVEKFDDCHFSAGNIDCPAQALEINVSADASSLKAQVQKAVQESDWGEISRLMPQINNLPAFQKDEILESLPKAPYQSDKSQQQPVQPVQPVQSGASSSKSSSKSQNSKFKYENKK